MMQLMCASQLFRSDVMTTSPMRFLPLAVPGPGFGMDRFSRMCGDCAMSRVMPAGNGAGGTGVTA
jgi:hypothetical protein